MLFLWYDMQETVGFGQEQLIPVPQCPYEAPNVCASVSLPTDSVSPPMDSVSPPKDSVNLPMDKGFGLAASILSSVGGLMVFVTLILL